MPRRQLVWPFSTRHFVLRASRDGSRATLGGLLATRSTSALNQVGARPGEITLRESRVGLRLGPFAPTASEFALSANRNGLRAGLRAARVKRKASRPRRTASHATQATAREPERPLRAPWKSSPSPRAGSGVRPGPRKPHRSRRRALALLHLRPSARSAAVGRHGRQRRQRRAGAAAQRRAMASGRLDVVEDRSRECAYCLAGPVRACGLQCVGESVCGVARSGHGCQGRCSISEGSRERPLVIACDPRCDAESEVICAFDICTSDCCFSRMCERHC